ncbi:MAG TPA: phospholipase D-like domain-containing protein [Candidatus Acidoferrales bacterium]|nr:phospholipase D-like domain-containing protein [Candidatus Acidoferrales bacterium]
MKFASAVIFVLVVTTSVWGQTTLVGWQVSGQSSFGTQNLAASTVATGITNSTGLTRGGGVGTSGTATSNAWGGNSWNYTTAAGALASNVYVTFGITVNTAYSASLGQIGLNYRRSNTGPQNAEWDYQLNGGAWTSIGDFSGQFPSNSSSGSTITPINLSGITNLQNLPAGTIVKFRIVPYGASSSSGTWYVYGSGTDLTVNGAITFVGEAGNGIGSAQISPAALNAGQTSDFSIKLVSDQSDTIGKIIVVVPSAFSWSLNSSDVLLSGNSLSAASLSVSQDTIRISNAAVTKIDTAQILIHSVTVPDSNLTGIFLVETAVDTAVPSPIQKQPSVYVMKVEPIIDLHTNDSQGVLASPYQKGVVVTVSGIVTANLVGASNINLFIQDATAGINVFINSLNSPFQVGDSATITGAIDQYRGITEIHPDSTKWIIHSHGNPLPEPLLLTCADVNQTFTDDSTEPNEGRLVRVNGVTCNSSNGTITDITGTTGGYIPKTWTIPAGTFDLIGILKQYKGVGGPDPGPPYLSDYEIDPRTQADIIGHPGPAFTANPAENNLKPNSVTIDFKTSDKATAVVRYGATSDYKDSVAVSSSDTIHSVLLDYLSPATVYHYQVSATDSAGTNTTGDAIFSTASPAGSIGTINVYFNHSTNSSVADGEFAQTVDIVNKFLARIDSAKYSIDLALYSLSGGVGGAITGALINAEKRGVMVRLITENDNLGESGTGTYLSNLTANGIPHITDTFDRIYAGKGLMHNKFAVFDFQDTTSFIHDWIWTGSWNATDPGDNDDAQNSIEIQDKALANAYTMEFNEMWGSPTNTPDASQSCFGADKKDITPHKFNIEGTPVELYFSPSDQTTLHIYQTLAAAAHSIDICMLTFTRADLAQELVAQKAAGDRVRVVMDNNKDSGNQFSFLQTNGVDVHLKGSDVTGLLHHKYAVIDAEYPNTDAIVTTGSHNWSTSAETSNDENELIIHSRRIANLYLQEFKARYLNAGGIDNIVLNMKRVDGGIPMSFELSQNYPNPFNPTTIISYQLPAANYVTLKVYDMLGRDVATLVSQKQNAGYYDVTFNAGRFASGIYFYVLSSSGKMFVKKMVVIK